MSRRADAITGIPHRMRGLIVASLVVWASFVVIAMAVPLLYIAASSLAVGERPLWPSAREIFGGFYLFAVVGVPLSLIVCFVVGYPTWRFASARGLTRRRDAIKIGALVGAGLFLVFTTAAQISTYMSDSTYSFTRGGITLTKDNLPTVQGLLFELFLVPFYAVIGAVAGLAAWWAGGEKPVVSSEPP